MIIPIVMASDDNYAPALGVAILSILKQRNAQDIYDLYILYTDLSQPNIERLEDLSRENFSVQCMKISTPELPKIGGWVSKETYYRLFAPDLLQQYDKMLYLDCDTIVLSDLELLYSQELGSNLLGAVCDYRFDGGYSKKTLGVATDSYVNAGVLLINALLWREEMVAQQCLDFLRENPSLEAYDQDAINFICKGRITLLEKEWNFQQVWPEIFGWHPQYRAFRENACLLECEAFVFSGSGILHYVCAEKPWQYPNREFAEYFWDHAKESVFYETLKKSVVPIVQTRLSTRGIACLKEHGLLYTLKRGLVKIKEGRES